MENVTLCAYWWDRKESVEQCANRVLRCLRDMGQCDPALARWFRKGRSRKEALQREVQITYDTVKELLLHGRNRRDIGAEVIEDLGFNIGLWNGGDDCQSVGFGVTCGGYAGNPAIWNRCVVDLPSEGPPQERLLKVESLLCLMRAVVTNFDPSWAIVLPDSLRSRIEFLPDKPTPGWLFYAANRLWPSPRLPESVHVFNVSGLGNIIVVSEEPLDIRRPEHVEALEAVEAEIKRQNWSGRF